MQQGKMFFIMGLCMALVQGGYVRRIPNGKEITAAMTVSICVSINEISKVFADIESDIEGKDKCRKTKKSDDIYFRTLIR